jgi:hypothetical protein
MLSVVFLFCDAECSDAEFHYAECHYAGCRGTKWSTDIWVRWSRFAQGSKNTVNPVEFINRPGKYYLSGRLSTVDLLVISGSDQLLLLMQALFTFNKTNCLNQEVNRTEPSPSFSVP